LHEQLAQQGQHLRSS